MKNFRPLFYLLTVVILFSLVWGIQKVSADDEGLVSESDIPADVDWQLVSERDINSDVDWSLVQERDIPSVEQPVPSESVPAQPQPAVQTAACSLTQVDQYPQCGGTVGLFDKDPGHVFEVTKFRDSCSGEETFSPRDAGVQENRREYPQCGGTVGLERFPATDTIIVEEFTNVCSGGKRFSVVRNAGNLGQCQAVPQPAIQPPVGAPQPVTVIVATPTPVVVTPTATPIPTIVPTVTPVPTVAVVNAQVRCPDGFVRTISNSNIICLQQIQNQTQSVVSTSNASTGPINVSLAGIPQGVPAQIVPIEVKQPVVFTQELPKTGLPLVAWAFSGLAPVGLKMKKFGASKTAGNAILALWQEREYLKS